MPIEIRALATSDRPAWHPLWRSYLEFYRTEITADVVDVTWRRLLDPREPMAGALAWDGDTAVGLVHLIRHRSCWTIGDYCYLQDLFVPDGRRGDGIGRRLIEYVFAWAQAAGCSRAHWLTHETNGEAIKLYDRIGDRSGFIQYRKLFVPLHSS